MKKSNFFRFIYFFCAPGTLFPRFFLVTTICDAAALAAIFIVHVCGYDTNSIFKLVKR